MSILLVLRREELRDGRRRTRRGWCECSWIGDCMCVHVGREGRGYKEYTHIITALYMNVYTHALSSHLRECICYSPIVNR